MKKNIFFTAVVLLTLALATVLATSARASTPPAIAEPEPLYLDGSLSIYTAPAGLRVASNDQGGVEIYCPCEGYDASPSSEEDAFLKIFEDTEVALYFDVQYGTYLAVNYTAGGIDTSCACPGCNTNETFTTATDTPIIPTSTPPTDPIPTPTAVPTQVPPVHSDCYRNGDNRWGEETPNGEYQCMGGE